MTREHTKVVEIDEAMLEMNEFIAQMTEVEGYLYDEEMETAMQLEKVKLSVPIQLDLQVQDDGAIALGGSPPLYYVETTILPVFHQLTVNIEVAKNEIRDSHAGSDESRVEPRVIC
jgi:hypothetical protein